VNIECLTKALENANAERRDESQPSLFDGTTGALSKLAAR
jgi:hypothetical protein